jgi:hypothetical protein
MIVDIKYLADFWSLDIRTVQYYADSTREENPLPRESKGKYDFVKANRWMYERQKNKLEILESSGDEKLHGLKMEGQRIANKEKELRLNKLLGEIVDYEAVKIAWLNEVNIIKQAIHQMSYILQTELNEQDDKNKILEKVNNAKDAALRCIAEELQIKIDTTDDLEKFEEEN